MAANLKSSRTLADRATIRRVDVDLTHAVHDARTAALQKSRQIFSELIKHSCRFSWLRRYLRSRRAILNGEKLFDLSREELRTRDLMAPLKLNVYKMALAALPATAIVWLISCVEQSELKASIGLARMAPDFWSAMLVQWQVMRTIQQVAVALLFPAAFLLFGLVVSWACLYRLDSTRETRRRCRRAFLYFDAAYGLLPQMLFTTALILYVNWDWVNEQIWEEGSYSVSNFLMGLPLAVAGFWPGYVFLFQIPRLLFDVNGYGNPQGIVSASACRPRPWTRFLCIAAMTILAMVSLVRLPLPRYQGPIPPPSGPFAIGRVGYDWIDPARPEVLFPKTDSWIVDAHREIMVYIWYPAAPAKLGTPKAQYFPNADRIDKTGFAESERAIWEKAWPMIVSGSVHTQAYENAPMASGDASFPLLIFSHGFRIEPFGYTHQIEELVSRGYIVATIQHTYEVGVSAFPDGRMIPFSEENYRQSHIHQLINELRNWEDERISVWADDIRFTLDQIARLNMGPQGNAPFAGHVDLRRVGAFGHSFGGAAAARACQLDQRIAACLNQGGIPMDGPFLHYDGPVLRHDGGYMPTQAFMFMRGGSGPLGNETAKVFQTMIDKELQNCCGSAYEVSVPVYDPSNFTDLPVLQAVGYPHASAKALRSLRIIELYTSAFFDKFLNGAHDTVVDREPPRYIEIQVKRYHR